MASQNYNPHPLPTPPSYGQQEQYSSYDESPLPPPPSTSQQHQTRQQQQQPPHQLSQQRSYTQYQPPQQPPQHQKEERIRPKSRAFSFRSDKSQKTEKSGPTSGSYKVTGANLHETSAEKESKRLHSKADPSLAMQEAEPSAVAQSGANFGGNAPLRSIQHKDIAGVPITEPDRSNPTRSRWERPLDTIRSFEAAVDGGYNRKSMIRADTDSVANWNRRSSYYGNNNNSNGPRFPQDTYYGGRPNSTMRPESTMFDPRASAQMGGPRDSYFDGYEAANNGGYAGRNKFSRVQSETQMYSHPAVANKTVYPIPNNHRSYETVASASGGSASLGEPAGYQTDPTSSENSSINRRSPPKRQEPPNDYGISFGNSQAYQPPSLAIPASQPRRMPDGPHGPPPPPKKDGVAGMLMKRPSKASGLGGPQRPDLGDKRKSWFSRRFSKSS